MSRLHMISRGGTLVLLEFATANPIVHVESSGAGIVLDEPEHVAIYRDITASLRSVALEHEPSVRFVAAVTAESHADLWAERDCKLRRHRFREVKVWM